MNIWRESIEKALAVNAENIKSYSDRKKTYEELSSNLIGYRDSLSPEILVPLCNRVLSKGNLVHTNEVLVSLGCGYFAKYTSKGARQICQRRIAQTEEILKELEKERQFLSNQINFTQEHVLGDNLKEIVEPYDEETEKKWRLEHRSRQAAHKKKQSEELSRIDDAELMERLDALELEEDLEVDDEKKDEPREFEIRRRLARLRQREKTKCITEEDIFKRLDELEEEENLEEELDRLHDDLSNPSDVHERESSDSEDSIIDHADQSRDSPSEYSSSNRGKRVSFAKAPTLSSPTRTCTINFTHTPAPSKGTSPTEGLENPSDIYKLFPPQSAAKPIIKNCHRVKEETHRPEPPESDVSLEPIERKITTPINVLGNIVEHETSETVETPEETSSGRQMSKFKMMRLKNKNG